MKQDGDAIASDVATIEAFLHSYFCIENAAVLDAAHTFEMLPPRYLLQEVAFDPQRECYTIQFIYCGQHYVAMIPAMNTEGAAHLNEWQRLRLRKAITQAVQHG